MIKKMAVFVLILAVMLPLTSCNMLGNPTEKYLLSMQNSINAKSLESKSKFEVHLDLTKAKEDVRKDLEKIKDITLNIDDAHDNKANKQAQKSFVNIGGIPIDFKFYRDGDNVYFKIGDKYYKPEQTDNMRNSKNTALAGNTDIKEYEKLAGEIKNVWVDAVKNEIISSEGTSVENTPDGDIKVTNLTLELTDEKEKNILQKLAGIASNSSYLLEQAKKGSSQFGPKDANREEVNKKIEEWFKNLPDNLIKSKGHYTLDKLKLTAKVDKDSYIINQSLTGGITIKNDDVGELKVTFNYDQTNWNINSKVSVDIPQIKKEDLGDLKDLNNGNSDFIEQIKEGFMTK